MSTVYDELRIVCRQHVMSNECCRQTGTSQYPCIAKDDPNRQTCTMLKLNDLAEGEELDQKTMSQISGGATASHDLTHESATGRLGISSGPHNPVSGTISSPDYGVGLDAMLFQPNT